MTLEGPDGEATEYIPALLTQSGGGSRSRSAESETKSEPQLDGLALLHDPSKHGPDVAWPAQKREARLGKIGGIIHDRV